MVCLYFFFSFEEYFFIYLQNMYEQALNIYMYITVRRKGC